MAAKQQQLLVPVPTPSHPPPQLGPTAPISTHPGGTRGCQVPSLCLLLPTLGVLLISWANWSWLSCAHPKTVPCFWLQVKDFALGVCAGTGVCGAPPVPNPSRLSPDPALVLAAR